MGVFDLTLYVIGDLTGIDIFYNLGMLSVSNSSFKAIPDAIGKLQNLFSLNIDNTPIGTLPSALKEIQSLKGIRLNYTAFTDFPELLTEMPQLTGIDFSNHNLNGKKLPDEIDQLKNLTSLTLMQTGISELPGTVSNLTELTEIDLRDNKLTKFPEQLLTLIHLKKINLNNNTIPTLPEGIGNLTKLTELQMNNGGLMMLPDSIGNLTNLTNLSFAGNNLMTLPESLKNLTQLTSIDLTNNILPTTIDQKLKDILPNLSWTGGLQTKFTLTSELVFDNVRYFDDIQMSRILAVSRLISKNPGNTGNFIKNLSYVAELEEYTNQNGEPIALETYIKDGVVIKSGTIYAKVRLNSKEKPINELFPTAENDHNLTDQTVQLNLVAPALTFISAPTELSFGGDLTISTKKQVYPLISLNDALSVQDNRKEKTNWRMTAKMTKELTASNEQQLTNSIHYRLNGMDSILNTFDIVIYQQKNSNDQPFNISDSWNQTTNGLFLEIEPGQAFSETYSGVIEWKLQDVPSGYE
ncbi:leucine-rich repeat domain-containing protein [Isobaculum melis]|uniref:Leucine rich repeat-containing protein n=1 Tax=Isobaculum melis TaxID=142588 RepID=A0A1H9UFR0_9LACT|nr:leucine-rich repeat domain-containing protein [Isobaculum melis]SES08202.1 Leucine rich repeat-containing protein [Isobaculum melis]